MIRVDAGLGDHVKDATACPAELHAKVCRLRGTSSTAIRDAERLRVAAESDVVIIGFRRADNYSLAGAARSLKTRRWQRVFVQNPRYWTEWTETRKIPA